ncbi:ABC transporter permease [Endozoicomonas sp. OPT23]|uniref:ABC transporter permease n=1 Tax=Endozoicomonas sp. OPT23 TaxID=2072845 RepID=UPI00129AC4A5|nr:ABC transporter permease subunit [Endozoicomonas sp. OPT23]MRI31486.1 ABC transporter permease [Endozoicomonas sp. OPT23]
MKIWRTVGLAWLCLIPFFLIILLFQILPFALVLVNSFKADMGEIWGLGNYAYLFSSKFFMQSVTNSLRISLYSSCAGLLLALPCAWSLYKSEGRVRQFALTLSNMVANFSGVPLAFAFVIILGSNGFLTLLVLETGLKLNLNLYSGTGLVLIYSYFQIPLAILLILPAFSIIRSDWQEAASLLGASHSRFWISIGLPVLSSSLLATFIILFANAMGTMATAFALTAGNYNLITIRINNLISGDIFLDPWLASALSILLVILLLIITLTNEWLATIRSRYGRG